MPAGAAVTAWPDAAVRRPISARRPWPWPGPRPPPAAAGRVAAAGLRARSTAASPPAEASAPVVRHRRRRRLRDSDRRRAVSPAPDSSRPQSWPLPRRARTPGSSRGQPRAGVAASAVVRPWSCSIATPAPTEPAISTVATPAFSAAPAARRAPAAPPRRRRRLRRPSLRRRVEQRLSSGSGISIPTPSRSACPRAVDRLPRGAAADPERRGDLLVAQAFQLAHHDRRPLRLGQRLQPLHQLAQLLAPLEPRRRCRGRRRAPRRALGARAAGRGGR